VKTQVVVDKKTKKIICTAFANGKRHDFRVFIESKVYFKPSTNALTDSGYLGLQEIHINTSIPKKRSKNNPLTLDDKQRNRVLSSNRVLNEHIIGLVKRFKIIADNYRKRRKRFGLRFNLIAGVCNFEL